MGSLGNLLVAQAGGATAVINESLVGAVDAARDDGRFTGIIGARHGVEGILAGDFVDLGRQPPDLLRAVARTPSAALGTTRRRLDDEAAVLAIQNLARHDVHCLAYIGGNDSADTASRLARAASDAGYSLAVVGIPKTIDNDLPDTDHCPGYGSIARFMALATRDAGRDTEATAGLYPVKLIEVMGRNAGWVAAATALGQESVDDAPQLIFFPERPPRDLAGFLDEIDTARRRHGHVVAVVPETARDAAGSPLTGAETSWTDSFGHHYYPSPGPLLARAVEEALGVRARYDKPGTIARMFGVCASETDRREAREVGAAGVRLLLAGASDVMVTLCRAEGSPYRCDTGSTPLASVANRERRLPDEFIDPCGRGVTAAFRAYAEPLIGGPLPPYGRLLDLSVPNA
ncbi:MAG TPA: diphosphate--fructose-6-phosphate 1-phosphotransferase [Thermomicrobiaceae bacterium]|nr:diphosphate--fructose-6-phosphate 1-phosphotransferase [Thermomicrobiaceae bacterium]